MIQFDCLFNFLFKYVDLSLPYLFLYSNLSVFLILLYGILIDTVSE